MINNIREFLKRNGLEEISGIGGVISYKEFSDDPHLSESIKYNVPLTLMDVHLKPQEGVEKLVLVFERSDREGLYLVQRYIKR
jgi:hypothetical protein